MIIHENRVFRYFICLRNDLRYEKRLCFLVIDSSIYITESTQSATLDTYKPTFVLNHFISMISYIVNVKYEKRNIVRHIYIHVCEHED